MTGNTTGYFGLATQKAVRSFQKNNNLISSGIVAAITRAKIKSVSCAAPTSELKLESTYLNKSLGFQINYPKVLAVFDEKKSDSMMDLAACNKQEWEYNESISQNFSEVSFGPKCSKSGGYILSVSVHKDKSAKDIINDIGMQFKDRKVSSQNITLDGKSAQLVTVTTNELKDWKSQVVIYDDGANRIITIGGGGDKFQALFTQFYKSFIFIR